jgi:hypothetical protein
MRGEILVAFARRGAHYRHAVVMKASSARRDADFTLPGHLPNSTRSRWALLRAQPLE